MTAVPHAPAGTFILNSRLTASELAVGAFVMKRLVLAGSLILASAAAVLADDGMFWVVGNHATNHCEIVTSNPVIDGDIWFADGPYQSLSDAKLARSTITACPNKDADN
jgi:hypothetical protein